MRFALAGLFVIGLVPWFVAWRAYRATSLSHALVWGMIAWLSWAMAVLNGPAESGGVDPARYCAVGLTGCAGVAVLGARRPHVFAWNFVVIGLFAVMVLPLVETLFIGTHPIDTLRIFFMSATIGVGILNYLPTRLAPAAVLMAIACAGQIVLLFAPTWLSDDVTPVFADVLLTAVPWIAWSCRRRGGADPVDLLWLDFRDGWGLFWGQRMREQFNRAAQNAGWSVTLSWRGIRRSGEGMEPPQEKVLDILRATLQRFVAEKSG